MSNANRPRPPEDLDGEALLEWHRVCDELEQVGKLHTADRAIMTLHCQTWAVNQSVYKHVAKFGSVGKWPNNLPSLTPWYRSLKETTTLLCKTTATLGLTPSSRPRVKETSDDFQF